MKKFAHLIFALNGTKNPQVRQTELVSYFSTAEPDDVLWALFLLLGKRPKKLFSLSQLRNWILEQSRLPEWLFEAALERTGDLTVTITRILPSPANPSNKPLTHWLNFLHQLRNRPEAEQKPKVQAAWAELDLGERFLLNKLLTGGFRAKFPRQPLVKALEIASGTNYHLLAFRLAQDWHPAHTTFAQLTATDPKRKRQLVPGIFPERQEISQSSFEDAESPDWIALRAHPGKAVQLILRDGELFLWSEAEEFLNPQFPEFTELAAYFPENFRLLGTLTGFSGKRFYGIEHFSLSNIELKPMIMIYDLLEIGNRDLSKETYTCRRHLLKDLLMPVNSTEFLRISERIYFDDGEKLHKLISDGRKQGFTGAHLYRKDSTGNTSWRWMAPEFKISVVLLYVQRIPGQGLRRGLELTFAVQGESELVPCARIPTHLETEVVTEIRDFVKKNTVEKFGPVRSIKSELVFEIAFDTVVPSGRHKAGLKLEAPRVVSWQQDKKPSEIDRLQHLKDILSQENEISDKRKNVAINLEK